MRQPGIEPGSREWESRMIPLHHWRWCWRCGNKSIHQTLISQFKDSYTRCYRRSLTSPSVKQVSSPSVLRGRRSSVWLSLLHPLTSLCLPAGRWLESLLGSPYKLRGCTICLSGTRKCISFPLVPNTWNGFYLLIKILLSPLSSWLKITYKSEFKTLALLHHLFCRLRDLTNQRAPTTPNYNLVVLHLQKLEYSVAEDGFNPLTSGLWAQHAPAAPFCCLYSHQQLNSSLHCPSVLFPVFFLMCFCR